MSFTSGSTSLGTAMSMKKRGRFFLLFMAAVHHGLVDDGPVRARRREHHVDPAEELGDVVEGVGGADDLLGELLGLPEGAVRDEHLLETLLPEVLEGDLAHLARADDEYLLPAEFAEDLPGELDRHGADGDRVVADPRLRPHPFRDLEGPVEDLFEEGARGRRGRGRPIGVLHLAQDLRLPYDHGIEAGGDEEEVPVRLVVVQQYRCSRGASPRRCRSARSGSRPSAPARCLQVRAAHVDLRPVARGDDGRLADAPGLRASFSTSARASSGMKSLSLTSRGRGVMIEAEDDEMHRRHSNI